MGSPAIFSGRRTKLLTADGLVKSNGSIVDNDGVVNYITNGHGEINADGWAVYADAAGAAPVDGTGGSANVTLTRTTTSPLAGAGSLLFTKDAANRQGQGASFDFTIDSTQQARAIDIGFDYIVASGTFAAGTSSTDSDLVVYIYDKTNAVLIQPSSFRFLSNSSTIADNFSATFQTASNSTSYRLILHCATTSASAYTVKLDNVFVSPSRYVFGTPITDLGTYTPTLTNGPTTSYNTAAIQRIGGNLKINGKVIATGAGAAATFSISIPSGLSIDTTNVTNNHVFGTCQFLGTAFQVGNVNLNNSTSFVFRLDGAGGGFQGSSFANGYELRYELVVPITGWSSSVQTSDKADTRVVAARATRATSQTIANNTATTLAFDTKEFDSHGFFNTSTNTYTVGVPGYYRISGVVSIQGTAATYDAFTQLFINGVATDLYPGAKQATTSQTHFIPFEHLKNLKAGDAVLIKLTQVSGVSQTVYGDNTAYACTSVNIERLSGPSAIAANELVAASYWLSANFAASTTVPINFDSKEFDTHGAVTTSATAWKFTAPIAGTYQINIFANTANVSSFNIYKNGSKYKPICFEPVAGYNTSGATSIRLNAGDYIDFRPSGSFTITGNVLSSIDTSNISIQRVGF